MPSNRMREIRARLDSVTPRILAIWCSPDDAEFLSHAPADIAWLLDEVTQAYADADEAKALLSDDRAT